MSGWEFSDYFVKLNGRSFTKWEYAQSWREQEGYAVHWGDIQHFWLYDSYTYHNGKSEVIYNQIVPIWIEKMGFAIDYDNMVELDPDTDLEPAVKALMTQRGCDIAVCLSYNDAGFWGFVVCIIEYNKVKKKYRRTFIPLWGNQRLKL